MDGMANRIVVAARLLALLGVAAFMCDSGFRRGPSDVAQTRRQMKLLDAAIADFREEHDRGSRRPEGALLLDGIPHGNLGTPRTESRAVEMT